MRRLCSVFVLYDAGLGRDDAQARRLEGGSIARSDCQVVRCGNRCDIAVRRVDGLAGSPSVGAQLTIGIGRRDAERKDAPLEDGQHALLQLAAQNFPSLPARHRGDAEAEFRQGDR